MRLRLCRRVCACAKVRYVSPVAGYTANTSVKNITPETKDYDDTNKTRHCETTVKLHDGNNHETQTPVTVGEYLTSSQPQMSYQGSYWGETNRTTRKSLIHCSPNTLLYDDRGFERPYMYYIYNGGWGGSLDETMNAETGQNSWQ